MTLQRRVGQTPKTALFCRNHREYLEHAAEIGAQNPEKPITFRASTTWKSAQIAVGVHGPRRIYLVPIGGQGLVEYQATLEEVELYPEPNTRVTQELLENCLPETRDEGLWEEYGETVRTLYVISHCRRLASPFPFTALTKLFDSKPIDRNYGYSYAICYEYCPRCESSPCGC